MKFSIRDLLWMTVILALLIMWLRAEYQDTRKLQMLRLWRGRVGAIERILRQEGWKVTYDTGGVTAEKAGAKAWASSFVFEPEGSEEELPPEMQWALTRQPKE